MHDRVSRVRIQQRQHYRGDDQHHDHRRHEPNQSREREHQRAQCAHSTRSYPRRGCCIGSGGLLRRRSGTAGSCDAGAVFWYGLLRASAIDAPVQTVCRLPANTSTATSASRNSNGWIVIPPTTAITSSRTARANSIWISMPRFVSGVHAATTCLPAVVATKPHGSPDRCPAYPAAPVPPRITTCRARSSVGERSLHTREVGGSKPPVPITENPANVVFVVLVIRQPRGGCAVLVPLTRSPDKCALSCR